MLDSSIRVGNNVILNQWCTTSNCPSVYDIILHVFVFFIYFHVFFKLRDEVLSKEKQDANWFSAPSALRVYGKI